MKKRHTAALLALLLGGFGVHKFYLRDTGSGIFYIMLTIFTASLGYPIGWILAWVDAFALFTMSDERFDKKYNRGAQSSRRRGRRDRRNDRFDQRSTSRSNRNPYENQKTRGRTRTQAQSSNKNPYANANRQRRNVIKDNPFKSSGKKYLKEFELDLAEVDLNRALELEPNDMDVHFDLGKLYSLEEKKDKSFYHLAKAMDLGFTDIKQFAEADELAYLRIQDEYESFKDSGYRIPPKKANTEKGGTKENEAVEPPKNDLLQDDLLLSQLNKLQELRKKGLLSENEFQEEKVKLMGR